MHAPGGADLARRVIVAKGIHLRGRPSVARATDSAVTPLGVPSRRAPDVPDVAARAFGRRPTPEYDATKRRVRRSRSLAARTLAALDRVFPRLEKRAACRRAVFSDRAFRSTNGENASALCFAMRDEREARGSPEVRSSDDTTRPSRDARFSDAGTKASDHQCSRLGFLTDKSCRGSKPGSCVKDRLRRG